MSQSPREAHPSVHDHAALVGLDGPEHALEVRVRWRDQTLDVVHLCPPRPFRLGDDAAADFRLDPSLLPGHRTMSLPATAGVHTVAGLTFDVREVAAGRRLARGRGGIDWAHHGWLLASLLAHGLFLLLVALSPPSASALSLQRLRVDPAYPAVDYVIKQPEHDAREWAPSPDGAEGSESEAAPDAPGEMGDRNTARSPRRTGVAGDRDHVVLPREALREQARDMGIVGVLRSMAHRDLPTSRYGSDVAVGADAADALGALLGDQVGSSFGFGGLAMRGTGAGGRDNANGTVGVGKLGTYGGCGGRDGCGALGAGLGGRGERGGLGGHVARVPPPIRPGPVTVTGSLSKETIRRVIGRQLQRVRHCYEQGLRSRPDLAGRVTVKFIIDPSGAVKVAAVGRSTLGHTQAEQCIAGVIQQLSFPAPNGIVSVTYPFTLQPIGL